ncbi:hypothetical protein HNV11_02215 [Spirosoma taeanense]|uniref:Uncharacterized protein n=1 Tax=Spirosoma taeanense TaxID=2735870 RepID=A0A6M5Y5A4_9BACT|nr:hypothetical protein [Spirosoma taeanense]QJW88273.1 hypothetical protein HNV11_02215 [Spirosoma taeanense]
MRPVVFIWLFLLTAVTAALAQKPSVEVYKVKVVMQGGPRLRGTLADVSETDVTINGEGTGWYQPTRNIPLSGVKKVVLRRRNRQRSPVQGAILGGLLLGYTVVRSSQKNGFRSPVLYGLNLTLAVAGGAGLGAVLGNHLGPNSRKVIRPRGRDGEQVSENLRRQLEPFTYAYQLDVLNRVRP